MAPSGSSPGPSSEPSARDRATGRRSSSTMRAPAAPESAGPPLPGPAAVVPAGADGCGELECLAFADAARAFAHVVDAEKPRVLAIGEAHAPKGSENVDSSTKRFREGLLPLLE